MAQVALADLETRTWTRLDNNQELYPQVDVDRLINEGSRNLNLFTGFSQAAVPVGLTIEGWQWYRIPSPIVIPLAMYLEGKRLYKSSASGASLTNQRWIRAQGTTQLKSWIPLGTQLFALNDADPLGGKYLECWGITTPALLVASTDTLNLDDEYADLISIYAYMNLVLKEGGKPFADAAGGYQDWLKRARAIQRWEAKVNPKFWVEATSKTETPRVA